MSRLEENEGEKLAAGQDDPIPRLISREPSTSLNQE